MSNVISFPQPSALQDPAGSVSLLIDAVANRRHAPDDVFWLKENAELLGVLAATGQILNPETLAVYADFYAQIEEKLRFFPQYYRFFLSICLDLEDLGMGANKGAALCRWVAQAGLPEAELSDLQRAEAQYLLSRRGAVLPLGQSALDTRLRAFTERAETFALPNKKAAYELTHIVFYLSGYGRYDPQLSDAALNSLEFAGVLAYLDQNIDLLAEICTALTFAGKTPSAVWTDAVARVHHAITLTGQADAARAVDGYHLFLVSGWAQLVRGTKVFDQNVPENYMLHFAMPQVLAGALRPLSTCLFDLGKQRSADWGGMRGRVIAQMPQHSREVLQAAEQSTDKFDAFFEGFARAGMTRGVQSG
ncbi:hypothetical protein Z945_2279 [Sulfitobacter noctilucae]|uniref:DUF6902 family protein n=1 Tax=Sulfitobacter noctilucae TaxID=1342302 RepID=UPI00046A57B1|nr:hypothetical protein [Sulfitobacter noctilucae]KIN61288.1 hypothetical protein Z945_2279 [Sulfitobacter noctilucae]